MLCCGAYNRRSKPTNLQKDNAPGSVSPNKVEITYETAAVPPSLQSANSFSKPYLADISSDLQNFAEGEEKKISKIAEGRETGRESGAARWRSTVREKVMKKPIEGAR